MVVSTEAVISSKEAVVDVLSDDELSTSDEALSMGLVDSSATLAASVNVWVSPYASLISFGSCSPSSALRGVSPSLSLQLRGQALLYTYYVCFE